MRLCATLGLSSPQALQPGANNATVNCVFGQMRLHQPLLTDGACMRAARCAVVPSPFTCPAQQGLDKSKVLHQDYGFPKLPERKRAAEEEPGVFVFGFIG